MPETYFVGDLCYVLHDEWEEVCQLTLPDDESKVTGQFHLADGREFFLFSTAFGDGVYSDQHDGRYSVDSGVLGAIRAKDIYDATYTEDTLKRLGCFHSFDTSLTKEDCHESNGSITFGNIVIETNEGSHSCLWWSRDSEDEEDVEDEDDPIGNGWV